MMCEADVCCRGCALLKKTQFIEIQFMRLSGARYF